MQHQKIRPSYADLQRLEGDFPSDEETSDDGIPEYAPAATPYRKEPPVVVSTGTSRLGQESSKSLKGANTGPLASSRSFAGKKEVRIAPNAQNEVYEIEGRARFQHARQHRANLSKPQAPNVDAIGSNGQSSVALAHSAPLLGTVQERNGILQPSQTSTNKKSSRFASARQRDKDDLQSSSSQTCSNRGSQSNCEEVWLDEEGQPMSAFRRKRLIDQGKRPPSNASRDIKRSEVASDTAAVAPDDDISKHNADRIAVMSPEEIEESLQQLKDTFGADTLEKLKSRKMRSRAVGAVPIKASGISPSASQEPRQYADVNDSEAIRSKYFPEEPAELPKSLQWTKEVEKGEEARFGEASFRFNFSGALMEDNDGDMGSKAYLEGLHHHGQEQDRAGYTTEELHHLARSTLSSQSILALQTLERIVLTYPEHGSNRLHDANKSVSEYLKQHNIRGKTAVIASWYLENRQAGLRHAAIRCLRACFISTLAGPEPPLGLMVTSPLPARGESSTRIPYDIYSEELALGLVPSLCNSLSQTTQSPVDRDLYLNTLTFLSKRSIKVCNMILKRSLDISIIVRDCITARSWPPTKSDRPISESLVLLLCLLSSSRANATLLIDQGYIEPLLRFLALPPWKIGKDIVIEADWTSFGTTMQIYEALASYGLYTHVVKTAYSLLPSLQAWIGQSRYRSSSELMALSSSLKCLNTWIVCAVQGGLDIDWNQISEWYECAFDCARESLNLGIEFINTLSYISVAADSVELLYNWISCARKYNQSRDEELKRLCSMAERIGDEILSVLWEEMSKNLCTEAAPDLEFDAVRLKQLSLLCKSALKIIYCQGQRDNKLDDLPDHAVDAARKVILDPIWQSLDSEGARQAGSELYRQYITAFCHHVLQSCKSVGLSDTLTLLRLSRAGQEDKVMELIEDVLPKVYCDVHSHDLATLRPFIVELIRPEKKVQVGRPLFITAESLSQTMTLFFNAPVDSTNQDNSDNVDPLSGAPLWKAACSGLPIRADWTFCALDDLLHSGNCASLNRKDALSSDWDANERQIVISTLRFSTTLWKAVIEDGVDCARSIFPSAAEAHLAIIKVFMLEEEQDQSTRASGLITGKDLFRDVEVQALLRDLYSLAKQLPSSNDDMEKVAQRQYGSSLPFYQLYTSLFGLYDSISFGMELFSRALMLAQSREYAADYRRLLWVDYAHCLPTFQTSLEQNPLTDLDQYLVVDLEKEDDIIQSMINALLTGSITKSKNELLWSIAIQQMGYTLWYSKLAQGVKEKIARSLYRPNITKAKEIQSSILAYTREPADLTSRDNSRLDWLKGLNLNVSDAAR